MEQEIMSTIWEAVKSPVAIIAQPTLGITLAVQGFRHGWETAFSDRTVKIPLPKVVLVAMPIVIGPLWLVIAPLAMKSEPFHWAVSLFGGMLIGLINIILYDRLLKQWFDKLLPLPSKREETPAP